jgi:hypothetical protein
MVWPIIRVRCIPRATSRTIEAPPAGPSRQFRPSLERLEDRLAPALSIALQEAGVNGGAQTVVASGADFTAVSFTGTYGDFIVTIVGGASDNGATLSDLLSSTTSVTNNSGNTATLNLFVTQTNYSLPAGPNLNVESGLAGSVNVGTIGLSDIFQVWADKSNNAFGTSDFTNGPQTGVQTGSTFKTGSGTGVFTRLATNYSVTSMAKLTLSGGGVVNFSDHVNVTQAPMVTIGDFVWNDMNANGCQDAGEVGIPGVTLTLTGRDSGGNPVTDHQATDANGKYLFTEAPGTYTVTVDARNFAAGGALSGFTASPTLNPACGPALDSNPNPSGTTPGTLPGGSSDLTVDFGYYKPVTIGDFVWNDNNANGCQDAGELGIPGVTLTLTGTNGSGGAVTDHATTDANGKYLFTEAPGTYTVTVDASNFAAGGALFGFTASPTLVPGCGTAEDSNPNPSGTTPSTLPGGSSDLTVDFGYHRLPPLPPPPPSKQQLLASTPPADPAALTPRFAVSTAAARPSLVAVGPESGFAPVVRVFDYTSGNERLRIQAYDENFLGGVNVAVGDVTGDGIPDIVTGAGPGGGPHVEVFDGRNGALVFSFMAYSPDFRGGVFVACGDVNGDGRADIITGAGAGGGPQVKVFSGANLSLLGNFLAYGAMFRGGVRVAAGDLNGDGRAEVITGAGAGGGPHVEAFDVATGQIVRSFMAYGADFRGGVFVGSGDVNGDGRADIITGAGAGGGPHVKVFDGDSLAVMQSFFAFDPTFTGGVTVAACQAEADGLTDLVLGTQHGPARVRIVNGLTLTELDSFFAFDPRINSGVTVG